MLLLTRTADDIPFDLRSYPHVVHGGSIVTLKEQLEPRVRWCLEHPEVAPPTFPADQEEQKELVLMSQHIVNYLNANGFTSISFERIRDRIDETYTDEKLLRLIAVSPSRFRRVNMSRNRRGIGLVA